MESKNGRDAFRAFMKPLLMERLSSIGLDISYHRGRRDSLFYLDEGGNEVEVLDFLGGFGASLFGHNNPELVGRAQALLDAARPFNAQASVRGLAGELAQRLSDMVGRSTGKSYLVTLANSGTEATEAAVKHAELEASQRNERLLAKLQTTWRRARIGIRERTVRVPPDLLPQGARALGVARLDSLEDLYTRVYRTALEAVEREPRFIAVEGAFHGKSTGSLMLTYNPEYRGGWERIGLRSTFVPVGDDDALDAEIENARIPYLDLEITPEGTLALVARSLINISGFIIEPLQGEGGIREIDPAYLRHVRARADAAGFPLILDEIQSGMGRTGTFLAAEPSGVVGDYYLFSKALGGGLAKVSALLVDSARALPEFGYLHTSTFADDDFSSTVALGALELLDRDDGALLDACREKGQYLLLRLGALRARFPDLLRDVRGRGLMIGIELAPQRASRSRLIRALGEQNLLGFFASGYLLHEHRIRIAPTLSSHGTLRLEPSAYVTLGELDRFCDAFERLLVALRDSDAFLLTRALVGRTDDPPRPALPPLPALATSPASTHARVGFLAHFLEATDLRHWDPSLEAFSEGDCQRFLDRTEGQIDPFVVEEFTLASPTGDAVDVTVFGVPFTAQQVIHSMRSGSSEWALDLVRKGVELGRRRGVSVVGFGGYTSIVSDNCRAFIEDEMALTSGNALTAAAALEALFTASRRLGIQKPRLGVVGAAGNIGAVLAHVAADTVEDIVLVGRRGSGPRLQLVADAITAAARSRLATGAPPAGVALALANGVVAPVRVATEMEALAECSLILSATNAARPVILPAHVGHGPVVLCDAAVPRDVDPSVSIERPNAVVLAGGIVRLPLGQSIDVAGMSLTPGQVYGCLAETMLLGLARFREHFSYGLLTADHLRRMRDLARQHGFTIEEHLAT